jgi:hypothetical protein
MYFHSAARLVLVAAALLVREMLLQFVILLDEIFFKHHLFLTDCPRILPGFSSRNDFNCQFISSLYVNRICKFVKARYAV